VGLQEGDDGEVHMRNMSYHRAASEEVGPSSHTACYIIDTRLNPRLLSEMASCDVASNTCQAHCPPRHPSCHKPSFLGMNGIL